MEKAKNGTGSRKPRAVVPKDRICVNAETARVAVPAGEQAGDEPSIDIVRSGDVIQAIDITCGCGKRMRLVCDYAN